MSGVCGARQNGGQCAPSYLRLSPGTPLGIRARGNTLRLSARGLSLATEARHRTRKRTKKRMEIAPAQRSGNSLSIFFFLPRSIILCGEIDFGGFQPLSLSLSTCLAPPSLSLSRSPSTCLITTGLSTFLPRSLSLAFQHPVSFFSAPSSPSLSLTSSPSICFTPLRLFLLSLTLAFFFFLCKPLCFSFILPPFIPLYLSLSPFLSPPLPPSLSPYLPSFFLKNNNIVYEARLGEREKKH